MPVIKELIIDDKYRACCRIGECLIGKPRIRFMPVNAEADSLAGSFFYIPFLQAVVKCLAVQCNGSILSFYDTDTNAVTLGNSYAAPCGVTIYSQVLNRFS